MIEGVVNAVREAVVPLAVAGPAGRTLPIDAVIDTGFSGFLTLPAALVSELQLPFVTRGRATLANGSEDFFDIHNAVVIWDGQPRRVLTDVADTAPLAGMSLLDGHSLYIEVEEGGHRTAGIARRVVRRAVQASWRERADLVVPRTGNN